MDFFHSITLIVPPYNQAANLYVIFVTCIVICNLFTHGAFRSSFRERAGKPEYTFLEKNLTEQGREPTTNSTHIWHQHICRYSKSALTTKPPFLQINDDSVCSHGV